MTEQALGHIVNTARELFRVEALHSLGVLDSAPEQAFDDLVALASMICDAPISLVSLIDADRQWFKARRGLDVQETPRSLAFCSHAIEQSGLFEVEDARLDPRFHDNALVTGAPNIRFYAGAPLVGAQGHSYGTLCVIDTKPRKLTEAQGDGLQRLARRTCDALETRNKRRRAEGRETTLLRLLESMPDGVVTCDAEGILGEFNQTAREWHGTDPRALPPQEWSAHFNLFRKDGQTPLPIEEIPLLRALRGQHVREAEIVIRATNQRPRTVLCNGEPLHALDHKLLGAVCVMHDVTQQRAMEDVARLEAERFGEAFAAAAQGMAIVSLEGGWLEVNDALCEILGYSREELSALDFQSITHPEDLQSDLQLVAELVAGNSRSYQMDKRYFHKSGRQIHAHLSVSIVRDALGNPVHFVSQIQDFTSRYQAEQLLRESEQKFRSVLEHTHDAFVAMSDAGHIIEWNRAAEVTFGWRRSDVIGKSLDQVIVPPRLRKAHRDGMTRFLTTRNSEVLNRRLQLPALHRAGYEFPIELTISQVRNGEHQVFSAFMHDITMREKNREELKATAAQLRTVTDNVPALVAHVGADMRFRFVNRHYAYWCGREPEEIVGMHMRDVMPAKDFIELQPRLDRVLSGHVETFDSDVRTLDGELRHMHATYVPEIRPDRGESTASSFHVMLHDQTAQVRLARLLGQQALRDELTGLPNRTAWNEELCRAVDRVQRSGAPLVVMFLDLDDFKQINDAHGHAAGDHVLKEFARALRETLRTSDLVARLAGDEFVVLLDQVADIDRDLPQVAAKILAHLGDGVIFQGQTLTVRPSIGIGIQRGPGDALVHCADEAMYAAKRAEDRAPQIRECIV